jgi:ribose transport system ATP-binding protein
MFDQPTVAVDVQAKEQILGLVRGVAMKGCGVLMHSVEPEELLAVCDTIVVVQSGRMAAVRRAADTNEAELLSLATGGKDVRA